MNLFTQIYASAACDACDKYQVCDDDDDNDEDCEDDKFICTL